MVRKDGAEVRRERIQDIAKTVQRLLHNPGQVSYSKTVAVLQYDLGLTKERIEEYLEILENLGQFVIDKAKDVIRKAEVNE